MRPISVITNFVQIPISAVASILGLMLLANIAHAVNPVNSSWIGSVAINGIDPVMYFIEARPVEGSKANEFEWRGATWRFANAKNRDLFAANPVRYAPQYGGYCAWAVSQGYTADIDPDAWKIVEDKLYLNYSKSVQAKWSANMETHIEKANMNWPTLVSDG